MKTFEQIFDDYNYPYGGHVFVFARPKKGWLKLNIKTFEDDEYAPCMISGTPFNKWDKRNIWIIGDVHSYNIDDFEIIENSNKKFQEIIELHTASKTYNI